MTLGPSSEGSIDFYTRITALLCAETSYKIKFLQALNFCCECFIASRLPFALAILVIVTIK